MTNKTRSPHYEIISGNEVGFRERRTHEISGDVRNRLYFVHGNIPLFSLHKYTGLEILCEFTGLPPQEIQRYIGNNKDIDKKYALRLIQQYGIWKRQNGKNFDVLTERRLPMLELLIQESIKDMLNSPESRHFEYRETVPDSIKSPSGKYISKSAVENYMTQAKKHLTQDKAILRRILVEITDPYYCVEGEHMTDLTQNTPILNEMLGDITDAFLEEKK